MEVHHQPGLEKKGLKEYVLEGLMIFIAVSMGFFAETQRERIRDSNHENEYARDLYAELRDDSSQAASKLAIRLEKDMDYITGYFRDSSLDLLPKEFYPAFSTSLT